MAQPLERGCETPHCFNNLQRHYGLGPGRADNSSRPDVTRKTRLAYPARVQYTQVRWVVSSVGRASRLHRECRRFEPVTTHHFLIFNQIRVIRALVNTLSRTQMRRFQHQPTVMF